MNLAALTYAICAPLALLGIYLWLRRSRPKAPQSLFDLHEERKRRGLRAANRRAP